MHTTVCCLHRERSGVRLDPQSTGPLTSSDSGEVDTRFRAEDAPLDAPAAPLARGASVDAAGRERQRVRQQGPAELARSPDDPLAGVGEAVGRGRKGPARRLEGICGITGHTQDLLGAVVIRSEIGIAERPVHTESEAARGPERVVGEPMGFPLIVERRAAESEDSLVSKGRTARRRREHFTRQARRPEVRIPWIQRRTILEHEARVTRGARRVPKSPRTKLPVRVVHREIALRVEATSPLE